MGMEESLKALGRMILNMELGSNFFLMRVIMKECTLMGSLRASGRTFTPMGKYMMVNGLMERNMVPGYGKAIREIVI